MSTINISDLHPAGSNLFSDSESYMNELGDSQLDMINGGGSPAISAISLVTLISAALVFLPAQAAAPRRRGGGGGGRPAKAL
jgi:lactobin A/cerein 7B family class IIb bacteriocin